jgi:Na+/H+ antiporter NhaD/arsenite permease-like protein
MSEKKGFVEKINQPVEHPDKVVFDTTSLIMWGVTIALLIGGIIGFFFSWKIGAICLVGFAIFFVFAWKDSGSDVMAVLRRK